MIEKGSKEFEKIAKQVQIDLDDIEQPIPYKKIIQAIHLYEKIVGKGKEKLSEEASIAIVRRIEAYFQVSYPDGENVVVVETDESRNRPKWWTDKKGQLKTYYTDSYFDYLYQDPSTIKSRNKADIDATDERTDLILDKLFDPTSTMEEDRRGLVMGNVQSGKTANYAMLINKAADAGFKLIIVLTGTIEILRQQTQKRLREAFIGVREDPINGANNRIGVGKYRELSGFEDKTPFCMTLYDADFKSNQRKALQPLNLGNTSVPKILVVKKNSTVLKEILNWLEGKQTKEHAVLIIDDEADMASVSTGRDENDPTKINGLIRKILEKFGKKAYVGYTATPFANVFIDPLYEQIEEGKQTQYGLSLYPKDFIIALKAPHAYIGAEKIFGGDEDNYSDFLVEISDWEKAFPIKQVSANVSEYANEIPTSLANAIRLFMMNVAIRDLRLDEDRNNSMLVHVSRLRVVHQKVVELLRDFVADTANKVKNYAKLPTNTKEYIEYIAPFQELFETMRGDGYDGTYGGHWGQNKNNKTFAWKDVLNQLILVVDTIQVGGAYSGVKEIVYPDKGRVNVIAVGGNSLARGFTLEDLSVSYFTRNVGACDTLLQMGRWFGYRPRFEDLCRIFMPENCINSFKYATSSSLDLLKSIKEMEKVEAEPINFLIKIAMHPASQLVLTAAKKARNASYDEGLRLDGKLFENGDVNITSGINDNNKQQAMEALENFIKKLPDTHIKTDNGYYWDSVASNCVIDLLKRYPIAIQKRYSNEYFIKYLELNEQLDWSVGLISRDSKKNSISLGEFKVCKGTRHYRKDSGDTRISMSTKEDELIGLEQCNIDKNIDNLRLKIRDEYRKSPLLLINIADIYNSDEQLDKENVPLLTVTFPGSYNNPLTKPLRGYAWNEQVRRHLGTEYDEIEEELKEEQMEAQNG